MFLHWAGEGKKRKALHVWMNRLSLAYESPFIGKVKAIHFFITLRKHYLLLLSGKNHEAFQKQHFPGQPICLVYILAILGGKVQDKA